MSALSQNLQFLVYTTSTVDIFYPNTATSTMVYNSDRVKGDGYYGASDGLHTVAYTCADTFVGTITMQASLAVNPVESDWFNVKDTTVHYSALDYRTTSTVDYFNFVGNFVWVRGHVEIDRGGVESVQYNH